LIARIRRGFRALYMLTGLLCLLLFGSLVSGILFLKSMEPLSKVLLGSLALIFGIGTAVLFREMLSGFIPKKTFLGISREEEPIYGFFELLVAGLGSTMGASMLTVLPYAIEGFSAPATIWATVLSGVVSLMLAIGYGRMYEESLRKGRVVVGGPAFVREAFGKGAAYFVCRLSMWIGTTALTAFNAIIFYYFLMNYLPEIMGYAGIGFLRYHVMALIGLLFTYWLYFLLRYESREKRKVAQAQVVLIIAFMTLLFGTLFYFIKMPGDYDPIERVLSLPDFPKMIFTAGYIYLVLFGFQEIQALVADTKEEIRFLGKKIDRSRFVPLAMEATVIISIGIFLFYSIVLSKFELKGEIPPLEVAQRFGGTPVALNSAIFMLAAVTTFTPSYLAASRHLAELANDEIVPKKIAEYSWLFTLLTIISMFFLSSDMLVEVADAGILFSLTIIALSELKLYRGKMTPLGAVRALSAAATCLVILFSFYFIKPQVFIYSLSFIVLSWFIFTLVGIGLVIDLFFGILAFVSYLMIKNIKIEPIAIGTWLAYRLDVILLFIGSVYLLHFFLSLKIRKLVYMLLESMSSVFSEIIDQIGLALTWIRKHVVRSWIRADKYRIIDATFKLEEIREKNPELYKKLKPLIEKDLEMLKEIEEVSE